jgi:hypothetical protein
MLNANLLLVTEYENAFSLFLTPPVTVCVVAYLRHRTHGRELRRMNIASNEIWARRYFH